MCKTKLIFLLARHSCKSFTCSTSFKPPNSPVWDYMCLLPMGKSNLRFSVLRCIAGSSTWSEIQMCSKSSTLILPDVMCCSFNLSHGLFNKHWFSTCQMPAIVLRCPESHKTLPVLSLYSHYLISGDSQNQEVGGLLALGKNIGL